MLNALLNNEVTQEDYIRYYDITIIYKKLPKNVYGLTFKKYRNYIVINSNLGKKNKESALLHEFAHIELGHLNNDECFFKTKIRDMEDEADRYIESLLKNNKESMLV